MTTPERKAQQEGYEHWSYGQPEQKSHHNHDHVFVENYGEEDEPYSAQENRHSRS
jgi:hypothetical protein